MKSIVNSEIESRITVIRPDGDILLRAEPGETVLDVLRRRPELSPPAPCSGKGRCGKCRVILEAGKASDVAAPPIHDDENARINESDLASGLRLACRVPAINGLRIRLEEAGDARIETRVEGLPFEIDPILSKRVVVLPVGSLEDQRSASERLEVELQLPVGTLPHHLVRLLPSIPNGTTPLTVTLHDGVPVAIDVGADTCDSIWTVAVDIGTTTVAMYLVNLADGKVAGAQAAMNRQAPYGADVISRLEHARLGAKQSNELQKAIVSQLAELLSKLCTEHGVAKSDIHLLTVAGNTAMIHLLGGYDPTGIGEAPFLPAVLELPAFAAGEIGLEGFERLRVWLLPSLSAYVGSDITGGLVASGMFQRPGTDLLLDIGTNGEMALGGKDGLVCCSTAAGPAFEGATLSSGLGSVPGAVDHIDLVDGALSFTTIDKAPPEGFCGSGVVDLVAFLINARLLDETGRLSETLDDADGVSRIKGLKIEAGKTGPELVWEAGTKTGKRLSFTQKDLREVQLAKGAIAAGVETLLAQAELTAADIETLWLAGGFGSYIRPESAAAIGLIPAELRSKTQSLGNASARGALLCMLSRERHKEAVRIAREARTIELSGRPDFQMAYVEAMMFSMPVSSDA